LIFPYIARARKTDTNKEQESMIVAKEKATNSKPSTKKKTINLKNITLSAEEVISDYRLAFQSREASLLGRREVMGGKAKFGIFGDGKEVAQLAMAKAFRKGDWRSGYYRDQTLMFALGMSNLHEFFAQLYAHADVHADPATAGRSMNAHFATRSLNAEGEWRNLTDLFNSSADLSPTGSQMPRLVGLGYASRLFREVKELSSLTQLSKNGQEIAFGTIGNATCAEGMFWEALNAIGVLNAPVLLSIWDDHYGISVPNEHQVTKEIADLLEGFKKSANSNGFEIFSVKGWSYPELVEVYLKAAELTRAKHTPTILHIVEMTQPQGHSTSGSQERYKPKDRLQWEMEFDCIKKMREWMLAEGVISDSELDGMEDEDTRHVRKIRDEAWESYESPIQQEMNHVRETIERMAKSSRHGERLRGIKNQLQSVPYPQRRNVFSAVYDALITVRDEEGAEKQKLIDWKKEHEAANEERYGSHLHSQSQKSALLVEEIKPAYSDNSPIVNGFEVLNACFDAALSREPRLVAFGEDLGRLGDVNQGFKNLQQKYGKLRVSDTGIRECTIIGQAIGIAMRGLRPLAEIQYLDYVLYALQIMSDDLATLHWRTAGGQKAPVIIRTRGHRLEGIWHSGSPMSGIINLCRGIHVCVPRDMTRAAGFYNTLLRSDDPGLVVEVLNGYRQKERIPDNIAEFTVPLGVPEVLREGSDVTIVTYGACCRIVMEAADALQETGVNAEVIDAQTLLPFDIHGKILESVKKTSRIVFVDEDVPGGATAYMLREVLEKQGGYGYLDCEPRTIPAKAHRPAYGSDGDYFSKPNREQVFEIVYRLMHECHPKKYPGIF
jgi:pyruvate/2-oxoglutarate/acetoin dehydrogenase E1 component/TPP-dependent pyruvate/acetoin dehydrogenase alpha subunit